MPEPFTVLVLPGSFCWHLYKAVIGGLFRRKAWPVGDYLILQAGRGFVYYEAGNRCNCDGFNYEFNSPDVLTDDWEEVTLDDDGF